MEKEPRITRYRKPRTTVGASKLAREVSIRTGFSQKDIKLVFNTYLDVIREEVLKVRKVDIPKLGTIYPTILRGRMRVALYGGVKPPEKVWVPDSFVVRMKAEKQLREEFKKMEVTEDHLNEIYYKQ